MAVSVNAPVGPDKLGRKGCSVGNLDACRHADNRRGGAQRSAEPARFEEGRMDSVRQGPQLIQGLRYLACELVDQSTSRGGTDVDEPPSLLQLDRERDQPLLGTVVELALEAPAIGHGGQHEPPPRRTQLLDLPVLHGEPTATTLNAATGRTNPLSVNSPAGSTSTSDSTSA